MLVSASVVVPIRRLQGQPSFSSGDLSGFVHGGAVFVFVFPLGCCVRTPQLASAALGAAAAASHCV